MLRLRRVEICNDRTYVVAPENGCVPRAADAVALTRLELRFVVELGISEVRNAPHLYVCTGVVLIAHVPPFIMAIHLVNINKTRPTLGLVGGHDVGRRRDSSVSLCQSGNCADKKDL